MNVVVTAVIIMLALPLSRMHVILDLAVGMFVDDLVAGMSPENVADAVGDAMRQGIIFVFNEGLKGEARIALSYAMPDTFAMAITHSGLPQQLAGVIIRRLNGSEDNAKGKGTVKRMLLAIILCMGVMSQNAVPIRIALVPMIIPPLLLVFSRLKLNRRLVACVITFGLVTTYMFLPYGSGAIFLNNTMLGGIRSAGMDTGGINAVYAMAIPALGMVSGLLLTFLRYHEPRIYQNSAAGTEGNHETVRQQKPPTYRSLVAAVAAVMCSAIQLLYNGSLILGTMLGFAVFMMLGVMNRSIADDVFGEGIRMMAMVGFVMIAAQDFTAVMNATGNIQPLVEHSVALSGSNKGIAAFTMLFIDLLVTMGTDSSFSTLSTIIAIYVPLCISLGLSSMAIVAIIGTAGVLGDAGPPASDSTFGPTMGLNADGQRDHIRDSVIPTFIHYNIPLMIAGWIAAVVL